MPKEFYRTLRAKETQELGKQLPNNNLRKPNEKPGECRGWRVLRL